MPKLYKRRMHAYVLMCWEIGADVNRPLLAYPKINSRPSGLPRQKVKVSGFSSERISELNSDSRSSNYSPNPGWGIFLFRVVTLEEDQY